MAVYENGTVSCWHRSNLEQFREALKKGWVVPRVPVGKGLSVHSLGLFPIRDARWLHDSKGFYRRVKDAVHAMNPEMANLYRIPRRETEKWKQAQVQWSADVIALLAGEADILNRCRQAHYDYLVHPGEATRAALRRAYEAVPLHRRMYLGDMDTRDSDILRHPESKREV